MWVNIEQRYFSNEIVPLGLRRANPVNQKLISQFLRRKKKPKIQCILYYVRYPSKGVTTTISSLASRSSEHTKTTV